MLFSFMIFSEILKVPDRYAGSKMELDGWSMNEKKIDLKSRKGYIDNLGKMVGETIVLDSAASAGNYSEMIGHDITFKARQGVNLRSGKLKVHTLRVIAPGFPSLPSDTFPYEIYYEEYN